MRQLSIQVEEGRGREVLQAAADHEAVNVLQFEAHDGEKPVDAVVLHLENDRVEAFIEQLKGLSGLSLSLLPHEVQAFSTKEEATERQTQMARHRSPTEIYVRGLRSSGTWGSFLGYAVVAGALSWVGLFTNTIFLLVAAMLVAPFPSPAMNAAVATAQGDRRLLGHSLVRYGVALLIGALMAVVLSVLYQQQLVTDLMQAVSFISETSVILPLMAGVAGGVHVSTSEENSLVSAAGAGMLVAAALSPPVAAVGMAAALGEWALAKNAFFLLLLQIVGINLTGTVVLRLYGMSTRESWYGRSSQAVQVVSYAVTLLALSALLFWQFSSSPELLRSTRAQEATAIAQEAVHASPVARLVGAEVRFASASEGGGVLVSRLYVRPAAETGENSDERRLKQHIRARVTEALRQRNFESDLLVEVTVLGSAGGAERGQGKAGPLPQGP